MSVHDCISEYKNMGRKVFGNPRPPGIGPIPPLWHKFDADSLEKVIGNVISRHGERLDESGSKVRYPSHDDLCKTYVYFIQHAYTLC